MEIWNERISYKSVLDKLSQPICSCHSLINCHNKRLLEIHGNEEMKTIMIINIPFIISLSFSMILLIKK